MSKAKSIYVVYANWCPHCVPTATEPMKKVGHQLGVPVHLLDIDTDDEVKADELVKKYGDWTSDYLIPQIFVELDDGKMKHVLTGNPQGVTFTRRAVDELLKSDLLKGT